MPPKHAITADDAPKAIGPYSPAIVSGDFIFCSGQIPLNPATGKLIEGDVRACVNREMASIRALLEAAGASLDDIVKTTIFVTDLADFPAVNEAYGTHFTGTPPARSTVQVAALPLGVPVEIEVIARKP